MTFETYAIVAGVIDAVTGLGFGLAVGCQWKSAGLAGLLLSFVAAFAGISGLVVGYEIMYGKGLLAGLVWAVLYSPLNLGLSVGGPVFCLVGMLLRSGFHRLTNSWWDKE